MINYNIQYPNLCSDSSVLPRLERDKAYQTKTVPLLLPGQDSRSVDDGDALKHLIGQSGTLEAVQESVSKSENID